MTTGTIVALLLCGLLLAGCADDATDTPPTLPGPVPPTVDALNLTAEGAGFEFQGPGAFLFTTNLSVDLTVTDLRTTQAGALVVAKGGVGPYSLDDACRPHGEGTAAWSDLPGTDPTLTVGLSLGRGVVQWAVVVPHEGHVVLAVGPGTLRYALEPTSGLAYEHAAVEMVDTASNRSVVWPTDVFHDRSGSVVASLSTTAPATELKARATALSGGFRCAADDRVLAPGIAGRPSAVGFSAMFAPEVGLDWQAAVEGAVVPADVDARYIWVDFPSFD